MRVMQRPFLLLAGFLLVAISLLVPFTRVFGQTGGAANPADLLNVFQGLSPDQQDAILKQLGGGTGALGATSTSSVDRQGQANQSRGLGTEGDLGQGGRVNLNEGETPEPLIPVLKGEDWVIIEVDFHLPPRPISQTLQAFNSAAFLQAQGQAGLPPGAGGQLGANQPGTQNYVVPQQPPPQAAQGTVSQSDLSEEERARLRGLIELIRSKNPYRLSRDGLLNLPGFAGMPVAGLTDDQASLRLKVEPAFNHLEIRLTRLPLEKTGVEGLKPFGYDLFDRAPSTFAPVTNVPVPADYTVGPGDELSVELYGTQNRALRLVVGRDGRIHIPELGPINVGGQLFSSVKSTIEARVERQMTGVRASVSMGDTRSIRVFVLGEAKRPGTYTVSGLGTITSALYAAGGVKTIGSLRKIQLKRQGQLVRQLDLYDMLLRGDTTDDSKLLQGDVIFIPPVSATVSVLGEVRRPAIYEIKNESTVADLVQLAGSLTPAADTSSAMLTRIDDQERRVVIRIDLSKDAAKAEGLRNGDLLRVFHLRPQVDAGVVLQGHVYTAGDYAYHTGMHLSDVVHSVDELQPNADIHYVLIRRELPPDRRVTVLSADLSGALASPGSKADVELLPRDQITVFDLASGRDRIIQPVLDELHLESNSGQPTQTVRVEGRVNVPGEYPLEPGMKVADLVRAGGGLSDAAYGSKAELSRFRIVDGETRRMEIANVDLGAVLRGEPDSNLALEPFDSLSVKEISQWNSRQTITLLGEVRFPGRYAFKSGETLRSVIIRAGGLTEYAFPEGSVFTREQLKKQEQEQIDVLAQRLQTDLTIQALQGAAAGLAGAGQAVTVGQSLLGQLHTVKAVGRLVIDLNELLHSPAGSHADVVLRNGDELIIPKFQQQVTVIGEVQSVTSHLYRPGLSREDYIALSGGMTRRADRSKIYVVRANGSVVANAGNRWFDGANVTIKPGDTVVVPLDTEKIPALPLWTQVTQILYNIAVAVAAVHAL
jgi:polysaccharide biosynthesis/export protein